MRKKHGIGKGFFFACLLAVFLTAGVSYAEAPPTTLVMQIAIDNTQMVDFIEGIQQGEKVYLPLGQLSSLLDFPIVVNAAKRTASGWFIRDQNKIFLTETSAEVKGNKTEIPPGSVLVQEGDLFIDSKLLQQWLPLDFSVDFQQMVLNIKTRELLPSQEEAKREKLHERLTKQEGQPKEVDFRDIDAPYAATQWPSIDLTFSPSYQNNIKGVNSNYSALAVGDFGYLTSRLYMAGNPEQKAVSDLRFSAGRDDYRGQLLGPAKATAFSLGDINSVALEQVNSPLQGRGFTMTNRALDRPDSFDVTSFIGDSTPGWQVELYRNGSLIAFQTVDTNGRYNFSNIPILFGNNVFRLAFYGPQGQRNEIIKTINADSALLKKGEFTYNLSADQNLRSLFGISDTPSASAGSASLLGEVEYGVNRWLTATLGNAYTATTADASEHEYVTAGLHSSFGGVLAALDNAYDTTASGYSTRLSLTGNLLSTDIQLKQTLADNFISVLNTTPVRSQTDVNLSRELNFPFLGLFDNNLALTRKDYASGRREDLLTHRLSRSFLGMHLTNTLNYDHDNQGLALTSGSLVAHGSYGKVQLDVEGDYDVKPTGQLTRTKLTALYPISSTVSDTTSLTNTLTGTRLTELENTVTFDMRRYKLSLTARGDTSGTFYVGTSFNTSIGKVPGTSAWIESSRSLAETGTVAVHPFLDRNYNQRFDAGEETVPGAKLKISSQTPKINDDGLAIAAQLPVDLPVTIALDKQAQDDPYLQDKQTDPYLTASSCRVVPRAGKIIMVDFPMFETSQIEGTVHVPADSNPSSLQVSLINTEGQTVASTHTAFDGYYLLGGVMPGAYKVRVSGDNLASGHLRQTDDRDLIVQAADSYTRDVTLDRDAPPPPAALSAPAAPEAPKAEAPPPGEASDIRVGDEAEKTRVVLDMTMKPAGKMMAALEDDGKTLVIPLAGLRWLGKPSGEPDSVELVSKYRVQDGNLRLKLVHAAKIKAQKILPPDSESKYYRLAVDLTRQNARKP